MKRIFLISLLLVLGPLFAQKQKQIVKVGSIDIQKVIDVVAADNILKKILVDKQNDYLRDAEEKAKEIRKLREILEKEANSLPPSRLDAIREDIIFKEAQLKEYLDQKSEYIRQNEDVLTPRLLAEIYRHVKDIAIQEGYSMIIEKTTAVVYVERDLDITNLVLKSLEKEKERLKTQ